MSHAVLAFPPSLSLNNTHHVDPTKHPKKHPQNTQQNIQQTRTRKVQEAAQNLRATVDDSIRDALRQHAASQHADLLRLHDSHEASMTTVLQNAASVVQERDGKVREFCAECFFVCVFLF